MPNETLGGGVEARGSQKINCELLWIAGCWIADPLCAGIILMILKALTFRLKGGGIAEL